MDRRAGYLLVPNPQPHFAGKRSLVYNLEDGEIASLKSVASAGGRTYKTDSGYEVRYFITDHLGSVRAVVNADGEVVEQTKFAIK